MAEQPDTAVVDRTVPGDTDDEGRLVRASRGRLIAILLAIVLLCEVVSFQYSVIGISVREIAPSFPQAGNNVGWMMTMIGLVGGATIALFGKMADLWGKKRLLLVLGILFVAGSLICATTTSWPLFLVGRGLQGTSLAITVVIYSLVRDIMPRSWVPVTIGFIGTGAGISTIIAPLIGGALIDHYSWRSLFWFLVVFMAVIIPLFALIVPESRLRVRERLDWLGAVLLGLSVAGLLIYASEGSSWGWTAGSSLAYLLGGLVILAAFWLWENRAAHPLIEPALLRDPRVSMVLVIQFLGATVLVASGYATAYMLETPGSLVKSTILSEAAAKAHLPISVIANAIQFRGDISYAAGFSLLQFVLHVTLWTWLVALVLGPLGGAWARRSGSRFPLVAGLAAMFVGMLLLAAWHSTWQEQLLIGLLVLGGTGLFYAAGPNLIIDVVPREQQGVSGGMLGVFGGFGVAFGTAALTAVLVRYPFQVVSTTATGGKGVTAIPQVYTSAGFGLVYLIVGAGGGLIALALALALRSGRTPAAGGLEAADAAPAAPAIGLTTNP
jgi:MFS family permease